MGTRLGGDAVAAASVNTAMTELPARLLLDLPNWLGDFCHTLPALNALLAANRGGSMTALLPSSHAPLAGMLGVAAVSRPRSAGFWWGRQHLRGRFDVAVTARHSTRAKLLLAGSGARRRLASNGRGASVLRLETFAVDRSRHQRHDLDDALATLAAGVAGTECARLPISPTLAQQGRRRLALLAGAAPAVALFPGSHALPAKRYPHEGYGAIGAALSERGAIPLVVVGPGEEVLGFRVAALSRGRVVPTHWALDEIAGLLAACAAAVGNDSGLTHLASLTGCPTVALFGPTDPARTSPVGDAEVLRPPEGSEIGEIPADRIVAAVLDRLAPEPGTEERPQLRLAVR